MSDGVQFMKPTTELAKAVVGTMRKPSFADYRLPAPYTAKRFHQSPRPSQPARCGRTDTGDLTV
jgi:hypothetical protein